MERRNTRELLISSAAIMMMFLWLLSLFAEEELRLGDSTPLVAGPNARILFWGIVIYIIVSAVFIGWAFARGETALSRIIHRFTFRLTIPGYFVFVMFPAIIGIGFYFLTGDLNGGVGVGCLGAPILLSFAAIELLRSRNNRG